jgi:hypothetical protein
MIIPNFLYKNHVIKAGPIYINKSIKHSIDGFYYKDISKGLFFRHHWNSYQTLEVLYQGFITTYDAYILKSQNGKWVIRHEGDIALSIPIKQNFLNFGVHGHLINDQSFLFPKIIGGNEGYRGYDKSSFSASRNIGALIQYQQRLFSNFFLSPFYELNRNTLIAPILGGKTLTENTVGAGVRYYFSKISIPAVIFDVARNIEDHSTHFHINIGLEL